MSEPEPCRPRGDVALAPAVFRLSNFAAANRDYAIARDDTNDAATRAVAAADVLYYMAIGTPAPSCGVLDSDDVADYCRHLILRAVKG
jgi:hypothetical protein